MPTLSPPTLRPAPAALVLAAGRGQRMRPLTDHTPKPLLEVQGRALLHWHLDALQRDGCSRVVINTDWLGEQIVQRTGVCWAAGRGGVHAPVLPIQYSNEGVDFGHALETAGGIVRALPALGEVFWVLAGDVFAPDFVFSSQAVDEFVRSTALAHVWLVPNPEHNARGDFGLSDEGLALNLPAHSAGVRWTYSTIGLYRQALFRAPYCDVPVGNPAGVACALAPVLRRAMDAAQVRASVYRGRWVDVGTPQRLAELNASLNVR